MDNAHSTAQGRDAEIIQKYQGGMTMGEVAGEYNLTRQRVCQILQRHGVKVEPARRGRRPTDPELVQKYVAEAISLKSKSMAARKFGVSVDTIARAVKKAGLHIPASRFEEPGVKEDIIARYNAGEPLRAIGELHGTRAQHINTLLRKWGIEGKRALLWKRQG